MLIKGTVIPGLVPGIHVDGRVKLGHDAKKSPLFGPFLVAA
jgi:hypothetical protein